MAKIILPGFIDLHVHLRDPEQIHKEDFYTGTCAALAGGFIKIFDMPNNKTPITTSKRLKEKILNAKQKIVCDIGFYFGSLGNNLDEFRKVKSRVFGLKLYLNETTGNFLITKEQIEKIFHAWGRGLILLHAEDDAVSFVIEAVKKIRSKVHFCHISTSSDLKQIIKAKEEGLPITCSVTPHHLFLTDTDAKTLGAYGRMKPPLKEKKEVDFLWKNLKYIDVIESDHAPHTIEEKEGISNQGVARLEEISTERRAKRDPAPQDSRSNPALPERLRRALARGKVGTGPRQENVKAPYGVPGLETTLPLLLTAVSKNRLTMEDLLRLTYENPKKILGLKEEKSTNIEIDLDRSYVLDNKSLHTKCGWTPFNGLKVKGKVTKVFIRGKKVFGDDKILVKEGFGKILKPNI